MDVRRASTNDIEAIVALGREAHERSGFGHHKYDDAIAGLLTARMLCGRNTTVLVAEHEGQIVGFMGAKVDTLPYVPVRVASDIAFYSRRAGAGRALMRAFERWAQEMMAQEILMGVSFGGSRNAKLTERFYRRLGFSYVGGIFVKRGTQ